MGRHPRSAERQRSPHTQQCGDGKAVSDDSDIAASRTTQSACTATTNLRGGKRKLDAPEADASEAMIRCAVTGPEQVSRSARLFKLILWAMRRENVGAFKQELSILQEQQEKQLASERQQASPTHDETLSLSVRVYYGEHELNVLRSPLPVTDSGELNMRHSSPQSVTAPWDTRTLFQYPFDVVMDLPISPSCSADCLICHASVQSKDDTRLLSTEFRIPLGNQNGRVAPPTCFLAPTLELLIMASSPASAQLKEVASEAQAVQIAASSGWGNQVKESA